jgi:YD repeat-containing protein
VTDPNGNVTRFTYAGQRLSTLTRVTDPAAGTGPTWSFDHSVDGQTRVTDARGNATTHFYDKRGRVNRVVDALGHERKSTYDSNSNVIDRTSAMANKTINKFNATTSNLEKVTTPTGAHTDLEYSNTASRNNLWNCLAQGPARRDEGLAAIEEAVAGVPAAGRGQPRGLRPRAGHVARSTTWSSCLADAGRRDDAERARSEGAVRGRGAHHGPWGTSEPKVTLSRCRRPEDRAGLASAGMAA